MYKAVLVIAVQHKCVTHVAGITSIVFGPVTEVIDRTTCFNLIIHHVIPSLLIISITALLHILHVGVKVKVSNHGFDDVPDVGITTVITHKPHVQSNIDVKEQLGYILIT